MSVLIILALFPVVFCFLELSTDLSTSCLLDSRDSRDSHPFYWPFLAQFFIFGFFFWGVFGLVFESSEFHVLAVCLFVCYRRGCC